MSNTLLRDIAQLPPRLRDELGGHTAFRAVQGVVTFADDGVPVVAGYIPADATVLGAFVTVKEAFDGSTTDLLDVGTNTDPNGFAAAVDVSTVGSGWYTGGAIVGTQSAGDQIEFLYTDGSGDAAAGQAVVTVIYLD